ncbi:hypothetical protein SLA2020_219500 [Shorea laevis]
MISTHIGVSFQGATELTSSTQSTSSSPLPMTPFTFPFFTLSFAAIPRHRTVAPYIPCLRPTTVAHRRKRSPLSLYMGAIVPAESPVSFPCHNLAFPSLKSSLTPT